MKRLGVRSCGMGYRRGTPRKELDEPLLRSGLAARAPLSAACVG
jgi:hypothetical protein